MADPSRLIYLYSLHNAYYHTYGLHQIERAPRCRLNACAQIMRRLRDPLTRLRMGSRSRPSRRSLPTRSRKPMRSPTRSRATTWTRSPTSSAILQLQVVFHAQMAEEAGQFTLEDVIGRICDKMERRHPHIFGDAEHGGHHLWEEIKAEERAANPRRKRTSRASPLRFRRWSAPPSCSAGPRASASTGPMRPGPRAKIDEELAELEAETEHQRMLEELGDLLVRRGQPRTPSQHRARSRAARSKSRSSSNASGRSRKRPALPS